jgi:hypothetical protein
MTRGGELFRQPTPSLLLAIRARITCDKESGLSLPTPITRYDGRSEDKWMEAKERAKAKTKNGLYTTGCGAPSMMDLQRFVTMLPTPQARDYRSGQQSRWDDPERSRNLNDKIGGKLNPQWVEWLMGWPIGWTDCEPLEMDKWQQWRQWHGDC